MSRLGILGGSFDPVHYGHLLLAENAREQCGLNRVVFVPAAVPPHKQDHPMAPASDRIGMLELAVAGNEALEVSRYEVDRGGISYTIETLRHFHAEYPEADLFLVLGTDMLSDLPTWREATEVLRLATPIVACRPGFGELDWEPLRAIASDRRIAQIRSYVIQMPLVGLSSTEIRCRVARGRSIRYQTPRAVEQYILTHGLYRPGRDEVAAAPETDEPKR